MRLSELKTNEEGYIIKVKGRGAFRKRITEMGFVRGKKIKVIRNAPLKDPVEYRIMDYELSLRRSEAGLIEVITEQEIKNEEPARFNGVFTEEHLRISANEKGKNIQIALVGNPNSGKTTLFNCASGSRERVGNYGGVTVESKSAVFRQQGFKFQLTDLPGTYSISAFSPEELFVRQHILHELPDVVINVVDASNLERNLFLTTQLIDMDIRVVVALNMYDDLTKKGFKLDYQSLGAMLGIPVVPTVASRGRGIRELFERVIDVYTDEDPDARHVHIHYGQEVEASLKKLQDLVWENKDLTDRASSRFFAIKLLEKDQSVHQSLSKLSNYSDINNLAEQECERLEKIYQEDTDVVITDARYGFISGALRETFTRSLTGIRKTTDRIDHVLTHRVLGFPFFFLFMFVMFFTTFELGKYPMKWIESLVGWLGISVSNQMASGPFHDLLVDGIIGGVGSVIVFLPNILILFFFISLMEDTGYMARAAFIMDKVMHRIGLHGKSFIPLVMGFGCNVPAIMSTRTIENRKNRILTILINPFMSCSARLPVYILIIGAFFPRYPGLVLFLVYIIGIAMAAMMAILFNKTIFRSKEAPFVMELPPYRIPTLRTTSRHMWHKGVQYLNKMGGVILAASVIIWALGYYPRVSTPSANSRSVTPQAKGSVYVPSESNPELHPGTTPYLSVNSHEKAEQQMNSYIGRIGRFIEPVLHPLGFDWKMGVALLTGVAAKEVVISTLGVLYQTGNYDNDDPSSLVSSLREASHSSGPHAGQRVFTPVTAFAFLLFILIYFPCVAVVAAVKKETGKWQWAVFLVVYTTLLAWTAAFMVNKLGNMLFY